MSRLRTARLRRLARAGRAPLSALYYHRVADTDLNDWTISRSDFAAQIGYCRENFEMISLDELQRRIRQGHSPRPTVTITFDDGYAENSEFALPLLADAGVPCTYFVTTQNVLTGHPFAHDLGAGRPLAVNTPEQVRAAADAGIEIGLHTANHVDFSRVTSADELRREIVDAKAELEAMIDRPVRHFAIPFGMPPHARPAVFAVARQAGLTCVCTAFGGTNEIGDDPFHIRRWHGDPCFSRTRNWLSYSPRKERQTPRLSTEDPLLDELLNQANRCIDAPTDETSDLDQPALPLTV